MTAVRNQLIVNEIFHSIQGESTWAGVPCSFVRLTGCNLRCTWCDTAYAFEGGTSMTVDEVLEHIAAADLPLVEITGGEPLLQEAVYPLMEALLRRRAPVLLETNGSVNIDRVPVEVHRIVDLKPPGSGEVDKNNLKNLTLLTRRDEVKFVLVDRPDYDWALDMTSRHGLTECAGAVIFSPAQGRLDPALLADWMVRDRLAARLGIQLHRVIWPDRVRGV